MNRELQKKNEELIQSQEMLRQSEARLRQAEAAAKIGHWTLQLDTKTVVASKGAELLYGVDFQLTPLEEIQKIPLPEYRPMLDKALKDLIATNAPYDLEFKIKRKNDGVITDIHSVATFDRKANTVFGVIQDITSQKNAELERESQRTLLSMVMDTSPVGIATVDAQGVITYANYRAEQLLGIEKDTITKRAYNAPAWNATDVEGRPFPDESQPFSVVKRTKRSAYNIQHGIVWPDGRCVFLSVNASPIFDREGEFSGMVATFEDITERLRNEKIIGKQLAEKELLLREVHHRIKNNMSTISTLLSLQADNVEEGSAANALRDAENRIQSMALLYDKLYQSQDYTESSVKDYLSALVDEVVASFPGNQNVRVECQLQDFTLHVNRLQPLGIIINELLTNIVKYAFKGKAEGLISVSARNDRGHVIISVRDDGHGIPESVSFEKSTGFGLQLVNALTQQLNGTIRMDRGTGTSVVLEFEL